MDRRQFLRVAGAGAALWAAGEPFRARASFDPGVIVDGLSRTLKGYAGSILHQPAPLSPIDTIVIIQMENRSFDHYFGWLPSDERYMEEGRRRYGANFAVDGLLDQAYPDPQTGEMVSTYHLPTRAGEQDPWRGCGHPDPGHGPGQGRAQRDRGFIANGSGNDEFALGYFLARDLPIYTPLVRNFTTFDRYFCSLLSSTYPNRLYLQSAQCGDDMDPGLPIEQGGFDWPCIWDRLLAANVSCGNYFTDVPSSLFFGAKLLPIMRPIVNFFVDAAVGALPNVTLIDPSYLTGFRMDDHPLGDMRVAQAFVGNIMKAITRSPQWRRTVVFITYDEWGGFFDHVAPPVLPDARASSTDAKNFGQAGFRVPAMMVSPYARPGFVDHRVYDHTSILRFLEWRFLGAPPEGPGGNGWWLTERDRHANNIGASLGRRPRADVHLGRLPRVPLASTPCVGEWFQDVPVLRDYDREGQFAAIEAPVSGMELFKVSGYLERLGIESNPGISVRELLGQ